MSLQNPYSETLLVALTQPGPDLPDAEFQEWYDEEHIPLRMALNGFLTAIRLEAIDDKKPHWGALYDVKSSSVLQSEEYQNLGKNRSEREKSVISRLTPLDRRVYKKIGTGLWNIGIGTNDALTPKIFVLISLTPKPELEEEFHRWYEQEHIEMLSKCPGWLRSRRFELVEQGGTDEKPPKYLAIHEYADEKGIKSAEWKAATSTPWRNRMIENVVQQERRIFKLTKRAK